MTEVLDLIGAERITRPSMFAVEFADPLTDLLITSGLVVNAKGLGPPIRTLSGRYAWNDSAPPADRTITVRAISTDGRYADFEQDIEVPAHQAETKPAELLFRKHLTATGLYLPPEGTTAIAGELLAGAGTPPTGLEDVTVEFVMRREEGNFTSTYTTTTDSRGGFVAVLRGSNDRVPKHRKNGLPAAFLKFSVPHQSRYSDFLPLRLGRLVYTERRLIWDRLGLVQPN